MQLLFVPIWLFTIVTTFALLIGLPIAVPAMGLRYWRTHNGGRRFAIVLAVMAGFLLGATISWSLRPAAWGMPFWETAYAAGHSDIYGHTLEHQAENLLFWVLFLSDVAALSLGTIAALGFRVADRMPRLAH